jgi:hypothetical protein
MVHRLRFVRILGPVILVTLAACTQHVRPSPSGRSGDAAHHPGGPTSQTPEAAATAKPCPVTQPNGATPPGEQQSGLNHGNGKLWTVLWPHGVVLASGPDQVYPDGSVRMKFPWWRGVMGRLSIEGHRLDAPAAPLRAVMSDYGLTGFQASGIIFQAAGCWEVTGRVKTASLTFVTLVVAR